MKVFDLTPVDKSIPLVSDWVETLMSTDVLPRHMSIARIRPDIMSAARPLRHLIDQGFSAEWLSFWEAYSYFLKNHFAHSAAVDVNTFHICDNNRSSVDTIQRYLGRINSKWTWLATFDTQAAAADLAKIDHGKWSLGVDGEGRVSASNIRSWQNWIRTSLQRVDIIVGASPHYDDIVGEIVFSLLNLSAAGSALIYIPDEILPNITPIIYLFSKFFIKTQLIHTLAAGRMYLCGLNITPPDSKTQKMIMSYGWATFIPEYMSTESYVVTAAAVATAHTYSRDTAAAEHEKMTAICAEISKSTSMKLFGADRYIESKYRDYSDEWERATNFIV